MLAFAYGCQGSERVRCRLSFTLEIYQDNQKFVFFLFFLFISFTSLHLHFLMFPSLVESYTFRLSSCEHLLINVVAYQTYGAVYINQGPVSFILIHILIESANHFFAFFRLIQHIHAWSLRVAYDITCNITLQYIDIHIAHR